MRRRDALKNMGLATGFFVATPTIISLLQSCTSEIKTWVPTFLTVEQGIALTKIVDIILPKTDLPSATEVNVPQFIDTYFNEVLDEVEQAQIKIGFESILTIIRPNTADIKENSIDKVTDDVYKSLLDNYMLIKGEEDIERDANPHALELTKSEVLNTLKWMSINAYLNTQQIGENVLVYDPVPTAYYCGDLQELTGGKSYSL